MARPDLRKVGVMAPRAFPVSGAVIEAFVDAMTIDDLRHLVYLLEARRHIPDNRAVEIAERLAAILSSDPIDHEVGPIPNRPTIGFFRRYWPERLL